MRRHISTYVESEDEDDQEEVRDASSESSIGSIPWADDAIKQNQLDWEKVVEALRSPNVEILQDQILRNEIQQWQEKFPQLFDESVDRKIYVLKETSKDDKDFFLESDALSNLSLTSIEEYSGDKISMDHENYIQNLQHWPLTSTLIPDKRKNQRNSNYRYFLPVSEVDFQITSKPLSLRQRPNTNYSRHIVTNVNGNQYYTPNPQSSKAAKKTMLKEPTLNSIMSTSANFAQQRSRMLPIINGLESGRNYPGEFNKPSFVQLTQIQQVNTANVSPQTPVGFNKYHASKATASRLSASNRNLVILPSLKQETYKDIPDNSINEKAHNRRLTKNIAFSSRSVHGINMALSASSTASSSTSTRSNSALIHQNYKELRNFYFPHSASKLKSLK